MLGDKQMSGTLDRLMSRVPRVAPDGSRLQVLGFFMETLKRIQVIVCSATLRNFAVQKFADRYMHFPQWIDLKVGFE